MKQPFFLFVVCLLFPVFSSAQARYAGMGIYAGVSTLRPYHQLRPLLSPSFHYYWVSNKGSMHGLSLSEAVVDVERMEARQNGNWLYGNQEVYVQWGVGVSVFALYRTGQKVGVGGGGRRTRLWVSLCR